MADTDAAGGGSLDALQRLWTPWRMGYIKGAKPGFEGCPFCVLPARGAEADAESLILHRGDHAFVILNAYPYNPGHLMAVPYRHVAGLDEVTPDELHEMADLCQRAVRALKAASGPHAFNVGINVGGLAGAGIADHLHQHVVPRWGGDTNFMPVVGQTRVLPELLEETYARLAPAFAAA
ncbi:MAG: HIT domain-containing protein [Actinomycetota bacterium]|nr:HIT domain-containing protein [Actinomycetota bacterium]